MTFLRRIVSFWLIFAGEQGSSHSPGPASVVLELSDKFLDVKNDGLWLVKFYAPWCGHCKKLAPVWEQVGHALSKSDVRVASLDCTRFSNVASTLDIHGFPTVQFFRNGQVLEYNGDRTKEAIVNFAKRVAGPEVGQVKSLVRFQEIRKEFSASSFFLLITDEQIQRAEEEAEYNKRLVDLYESVAKNLFVKTQFFRAERAFVPKTIIMKSLPTILCFKDGTYFAFDSQVDEPIESALNLWIESERWPMLPQITYGNLYDIGSCCNKFLVLASVDYVGRNEAASSSYRFFKLMESTAKNHRKVLHARFQFGWLDGASIANNIVMGSVGVPSLVVLNLTSYLFYTSDDAADKMTENSLAAFLRSVESGEKPAQGGRSLLQRIKRALYELFSGIYNMFASQPLLSCCLFGLPLAILAVICYTLCSSDFSIDHSEIYPDSDEDEDSIDHDKLD